MGSTECKAKAAANFSYLSANRRILDGTRWRTRFRFVAHRTSPPCDHCQSTTEGRTIPFVGKVSARLRVFELALAALAVVMAACSGSESGGSTVGTGQCQAACGRCGGDPCVDCAAYSARFRDEFEGALFSCVQNAAACSSQQWETCFGQAVGQAPRRSIDDQYTSACMTKRMTCDAAGMGFADDYCLSSQLLEESMVARANDCLALACTDALAWRRFSSEGRIAQSWGLISLACGGANSVTLGTRVEHS